MCDPFIYGLAHQPGSLGLVSRVLDEPGKKSTCSKVCKSFSTQTCDDPGWLAGSNPLWQFYLHLSPTVTTKALLPSVITLCYTLEWSTWNCISSLFMKKCWISSLVNTHSCLGSTCWYIDKIPLSSSFLSSAFQTQLLIIFNDFGFEGDC